MGRKGEITIYKKGEIYKNNKNLSYEIIDYCGKCLRKIRFLDSGYEVIVHNSEIKSGNIKDVMSPSVCNIGITGMRNASKHYLYPRWHSMISRCYNEDDIQYKNYGGKGVTVCKEWLIFANYIKDIESKENSEKLKESRDWCIDKDILCGDLECKIYSNETTVIIHNIDNVRESDKRYYERNKGNNSKSVIQYDLNMNVLNVFESITEASEYIEYITGKKACDGNISRCCRGIYKTSYGYIWRYK